MSARQLEEHYALGIYPRRGITLVRGSGALVWDDAGTEYLDCATGVGVANLGHAHPAVAAAI
ncbi:MAG: aminotransferase class III-fold pyridoxal phosphate-dependent enzyme, partial [Arenicellales bacterium]|nr:aminotransferase class III-fold pyridoxal phosphate-dependent enzyme [Arenicellales bacterium]